MTGNLPPGWAAATLGDVFIPRKGKHTPGPSDQRPYLSLDNIESHTSRITGWERSSDYSSQSSQLFAGDIAYARLRPYLNKIALIDREALGSAEFIVLPRMPEVLPSLLCYRLLSPDFVRFADQHSTGDRPRLKWAQMRDFPLGLPPFAEQQRIVAAIEEHFSRLDAADGSMAAPSLRAARLLESVLQAELGAAKLHNQSLGGFLTEPLANGRSVPTADEHGFPVLRLTCLKRGRVDTSESKQGNFGEIDHRRYQVQPDDFLISRGNGSLHLVGIGGLVPHGTRPVAYPDTLIRARVDRSRLRPEFLSLIWNSRIIRRQLEPQARTTAGIYKVNQSMIGNVTVPAPSPDAQDRIARRLESVRHAVLQLDAEVDRYRLRSASLRRSILSMAFSGRLVPQNPNDEPASALLERIAGSRPVKASRRTADA